MNDIDVRKTVEQWKLELLPQPQQWKSMDARTHYRTKGRWQPGEEAKAGSKDWLYNSAARLHKWVVGEELTKEEFLKALDDASKHFVRNN